MPSLRSFGMFFTHIIAIISSLRNFSQVRKCDLIAKTVKLFRAFAC